MRTFVILCALLCAFTIVESQKNNVKWGNIGPYDTLLHREIVKQKSKFLRVVTQDLNYSVTNYGSITGIRITDQGTAGNGGNAVLKSGGAGFNFTKIHFKSQRGEDLNMVVEIYGRR